MSDLVTSITEIAVADTDAILAGEAIAITVTPASTAPAVI
jgi:hypothetical protein